MTIVTNRGGGEWAKTPHTDPNACPARPPCTCDGYGEPEHPCQEHETEYIMTHAANRVDPECGFEQCTHCHEEV